MVNPLLLTTNESKLRITTLILNCPKGIERQLPKDEQNGSSGLLSHKLLSLPEQAKSHNYLLRLQSSSENKNESLARRLFSSTFSEGLKSTSRKYYPYRTRHRTSDLSNWGGATFSIETDS